jgi:aminoglycoside 2'-N-acetyltransferase I
MTVLTLHTPDLSPFDRNRLRHLLNAAFGGDFGDFDWDHALGGWHVVGVEAGELVAHAAVVPRRLWVGSRAFNTGYVEAVAVMPPRQRQGLGSIVMRRATEIVGREFELGALSTGKSAFYERVGWERWRGPSWVQQPDGRLVRTPDEDAGLMIFRCASSRAVDLDASITCEARAGDSW